MTNEKLYEVLGGINLFLILLFMKTHTGFMLL